MESILGRDLRIRKESEKDSDTPAPHPQQALVSLAMRVTCYCNSDQIKITRKKFKSDVVTNA